MIAHVSVFRGGPWNIYFSQRSGIGQPWSNAQQVLGIPSGSATDEMPWLNALGDRLYFMSNRGGGLRLWTSTKGINGFQTPTAVGASEPDEDRAPVLSTDELTIYFSFTNPTYVIDLNVAGIFSAPTWLSPDGCDIYLTSQRGGGGNFDVYSAVKPK